MFNHTSRYYLVETITLIEADGRELRYKRRRFLPDPVHLQIVSEVTVTQGDRLDLISAKTLGDPEQFWQVCDANRAMNPVALTETIGRRVKIPFPQFQSQ